MKRSFLMGWLIWQWSGPLSEVHLTVQGFAITVMGAAGKPGVLLPRRHPGSTAWKQITRYVCWPEAVTQPWQPLHRQKPVDSRKNCRTLLKVIFVLKPYTECRLNPLRDTQSISGAILTTEGPGACGHREWCTVNGTARGLGDCHTSSHNQS